MTQKDKPGGAVSRKINRYEITPVYTHPDAQIDIILLHGLNGDPARTWRTGGDSNSNGTTGGVFWPSDLLPVSLDGTPANVLVYGYNADVYSTGSNSASDSFIFQHAQTLVSCVTLYRKSLGRQRYPILWVAHSLGGLLLKRSLLYSNDLKDKNHEDHRGVFVSTYGIIFLGTPHTGSGLATWGRVLQAMADTVLPKKLFESESVLLKTLKRDNETLQNINNHFLDVYQRFKITMAHENHKTDLKGTKALVVDASSACPQLPGVTYYGIEATHSGMCKFAGPSAPGYMSVSTTLREWVEEASPVIQTRWDIELEERRERARQDANERLSGIAAPPERLPVYSSPVVPQSGSFVPGHSGDLTAPIPPSLSASQVSVGEREPIFIHPQHFRPNSYFVGRQDEMRELHRLLMEPKRQSVGTSAVLLTGMAGSGKTHLARQYVFDHKTDYPGGVYWVRATTVQDMESGFWQIAKTEAIREMTGQETTKDLLDPRKMVEVVRNWFNDFDGWLLVFDGIRFDNTAAVSQFIPDRKKTSLLFTSTESAVAGSHFYDNPVVMELELLPVQDAQSLLLEELGKRKPYSTDDLRKALELVQLVDRLPLMIHASAQQMKATKEPLSKYLKGFKEQPPVGTLPAYRAIRDELRARGNTEALNLIHILSFFSQHVPVEMLALGLGALDKRTPVKARTSNLKKSLNRAFVTLIAFALVERIEMEDLPPSATSSSRNSKKSGDDTDKDVSPLDILRIHTIIQAFFLETLVQEGQFVFWLERAISVFCESYDRADAKIHSNHNLGLPDDYRRYSIHGEKLLHHFNRLPSKQKNPNLSPELFTASQRLRERVAGTGEKISRLQRDISARILEVKPDTDSGDIRHVSIFERTNSLSTQSTVPSLSTNASSLADEDGARSAVDWKGVLPGEVPTGPTRLVWESTLFDEAAGRYESPLAIENPWGRTGATAPYPSVNTVPDVGPFDDDFVPDDRTVTSPGDDSGWTVVQPHRAVKRLDQRRYRDRAGAWRATETSHRDPRVGISRASASGLIATPTPSEGRRSPSQSTSRVSLGDSVKAGLMEIKKASPPPLRGGGTIKGRLPDGTYAGVLSGGASTRSSTTMVAPSSVSSSPKTSYLSGLLNRFTAHKASPESQQSESPYLPTEYQENVDRFTSERLALPKQSDPLGYSGGTRSNRSSPGLQQGPFAPPPNHQQLLSSSTGSLRPEAWGYSSQPAVTVLPPGTSGPWNPLVPSHAPHGYTSQPMSRNPSARQDSGISSATPVATPGSRGPSRSRSRGGSLSRRSRPASLVETEPSPRLPAFDIEQTSYQAWDRGRKGRARGDSLLGGSNVPPAPARQRSGTRVPNFAGPGGSPELGNVSGRSSPRGSPQMGGGEISPATGPGGIIVGGRRVAEFGSVPVNIAQRQERSQNGRLGGVGPTRRISEDPAGEDAAVGLGIR